MKTVVENEIEESKDNKVNRAENNIVKTDVENEFEASKDNNKKKAVENKEMDI